jgi:hypothetical protein
MHVVSNNEPSIEDLGTGRHERCNNRFCRGRFPFIDGKFTRVRGVDGRYYCDAFCSNGPYLTPRRYSGVPTCTEDVASVDHLSD